MGRGSPPPTISSAIDSQTVSKKFFAFSNELPRKSTRACYRAIIKKLNYINGFAFFLDSSIHWNTFADKLKPIRFSYSPIAMHIKSRSLIFVNQRWNFNVIVNVTVIDSKHNTLGDFIFIYIRKKNVKKCIKSSDSNDCTLEIDRKSLLQK